MMFFTGFSRFSSDIQKETIRNLKENKIQLDEMKSLTKEAAYILSSEADLFEFGKLLNTSWSLKRSLSSQISTDTIDILYNKAIQAGAIGGKLLGAGGGGFLLFFVPQEKRASVKSSLEPLLQIPFSFESDGTRVAHYTDEKYNFA